MLYIDEKMSVVNNNSILKIEYLVYGWLIVLAVADAGDIL
jgi:hypothetical protein